MITKNICLYIGKNSEFDSIYTSRFVLETNQEVIKTPITLSTYRMLLVADGQGTLMLNGNAYKLKKGDVFIGRPSFNFKFIPDKDFKYFYINFLGARANYLIDKLGVKKDACIFPGLTELIFIWQSALKINGASMDIRTESVILYTFSTIIDTYFSKNTALKKSSTAERIKEYIDNNFYNQDLGLEQLSKELAYSQKYISTVFKQFYNQSISEYVNHLRIRNALSLMEYGITGIKNIAALSGFNDPLYFSKVFKKITGVSPKEKLKSI